MEKFQLKENSSYATVTSVDQERLNCKKPQKDGNRKIIACMIFLFAAVFALLLGIAGACIGFGLELSKLQNDQTSSQQNGMLHQQLSQQNESINTLYQQLIDTLHQQLSQQNESINTLHQQLIDTLYQQLSQQNESINTLHQQLSQQNESIHTLHQQLIDTLYQQLSQQNESINTPHQQLSHQNESINTLYQQLSQQNQQLNSPTQLLLSVLEGPVGNFPFYPAVSCAALPLRLLLGQGLQWLCSACVL